MISVKISGYEATFKIPLGKTSLIKKKKDIEEILEGRPEAKGSKGFALILEGLETLIIAGLVPPERRRRVRIRGSR